MIDETEEIDDAVEMCSEACKDVPDGHIWVRKEGVPVVEDVWLWFVSRESGEEKMLPPEGERGMGGAFAGSIGDT